MPTPEEIKAAEEKAAKDKKEAEDKVKADEAKKKADADAVEKARADEARKAEEVKRAAEAKELEELRIFKAASQREKMTAEERAKADLAEKDKATTLMMATLQREKEAREAAEKKAQEAEAGRVKADADLQTTIVGLLVIDKLRELGFPHAVASGLMRDAALHALADKKTALLDGNKLSAAAEKDIAEWSAQYADAMNVRKRSGIPGTGRPGGKDGQGGGQQNWATRWRT